MRKKNNPPSPRLRGTRKTPLVLVILDGWGLHKRNRGNAITLAKTPVFDGLYKEFPNTKLHAHGESVGLPDNQDGNSEAGHMNIGAGRIVEQDSVHIAKSVSDGTFFNNPAFRQSIEHVKKNKSKLHVIGMISNGESAHANPDHFTALLTFTYLNKVDTYLHIFTDGRDAHRHLGIDLLKKLKFYIRNKQTIATVTGRFYSMDRKKKWSRTKLAYEALTEGRGLYFNSPEEAILKGYERGEGDEFIKPSIITKNIKGKQKPIATIDNNDAIIFYNLRSDRARQLTKVFVQPKFSGFKRNKILKNIHFVAMTDFGPDLPGVATAFRGRDLKGTLPMALSHLRQIYIAETEKYAHITYFFNGGYDNPVAGESRLSILSPDVKYYNETPEMGARDITKNVISSITKDKYDVVVCNFSNPDMIGHTGDLKATIKAVEFVDKSVGQIKDRVLKLGGTLIVTADHGNAENMIDLQSKEIDTAHSKNPVPFILVNKDLKNIKLRKSGILGDIAPTVLDILDTEKPEEMIGKSLIKNPK